MHRRQPDVGFALDVASATSSSTRSRALDLVRTRSSASTGRPRKREDRLQVERRTDEALGAADAAAPVQELKRVDGKVDADVVLLFLGQLL